MPVACYMPTLAGQSLIEIAFKRRQGCLKRLFLNSIHHQTPVENGGIVFLDQNVERHIDSTNHKALSS